MNRGGASDPSLTLRMTKSGSVQDDKRGGSVKEAPDPSLTLRMTKAAALRMTKVAAFRMTKVAAFRMKEAAAGFRMTDSRSDVQEG